MKKLLFISLFILSIININAQDTISVNQNQITKLIVDKTVNSKGKPTNKYYCIYEGELINTNKTTYERINLSKKYNAKIKLILVRSKTGIKSIKLN